MKDNKLYATLNHFDKIEQNRLHKYIRSPYFNANNILTEFLDILFLYLNHRNGKISELTKEAIWIKLFHREPYNDIRFRKLCSDLLKLIEGFLAQEVFNNNPLQQAASLLQAVGERRMDGLYKSAKKISELASERHFQHPLFYHYQYQIETNIFELTELDPFQNEHNNIEKIFNNLDYYFLCEKLKWYATILSSKKLISQEYDVLFIDAIIEHLRTKNYDKVPIINIYYLIVLTYLENNNTQHYYELINKLKHSRNYFQLNEQCDAYQYALNYCISKFNLGSQEFLNEYFRLAKYLIENEILFTGLPDDKLAAVNFRGVVSVALRLKEYNWTEKFIKDIQNRLPVDQRETAVGFSLAQVYFYQKKYDLAISLLATVEYDDITYNLNGKSMLMAIYYEKDDFEALTFLMDSFKTFLTRHTEMSDVRKKLYLNLIKYTRKLTKIMPGDRKAVEQIKKELEEAKGSPIASERWLREKIAELE